ncbi:chemotaxis protein CheA [Clostridium massiliamazoniense]|uniref:chemotaxis protein CheA n=1 Tax=Clostridium massiliamazoniense TaxID=1347366 RepID=UPI0006D7EB01|nr:chemotaxis protein CheA [Clostridium massiliamazoniense]
MDTTQYMSMFLEESKDNLQMLNDCLLDLEKEPENIEKIGEIFRVAHTMKGMAATMGFNHIAELTHKMEDVLSKFRDGEIYVTAEVVTVLFKCLDGLERMVDNVENSIEENSDVNINEIMKELVKVSSENIEEKEIEIFESKELLELNEYDLSIISQAKERGFEAFKIKIELDKNTLLKSARAFLILKDLEELGEVIKSYPSTEDVEAENFEFTLEYILLTETIESRINETLEGLSEVDGYSTELLEVDKLVEKKIEEEVKKIEEKKEEVKEKPKNVAKKTPNKSSKAHQSVRVDLERLDKLMNMVSELVIHRTRLEQVNNDNRFMELNEILEQVARTTSDLQDLVMKIRMLPLEVVFNRFPRMIRDVAVDLKKEINFIIEGQDTELDRTVIDEIGEPLIHLLRNAADHGIESRENREKAGKSPVGTIKLTAYQEGTKAVIKVEDDGAGVNISKVKAKAEKVGINTEGLSEDEIRNLIFAQGFSTNEVVTDLSGRGVGMDVVKTKISALGGTIELYSEEGKGSTFIIKLPLTLQIIQALLVKVGEENFAISLGFIDRVIDYREDDIKKTNGKEVVIYRENIIPLIRLNEVFEIESSENAKKFIIIVKVGSKEVGLLVDSLLGQQEVVIKPLGKTLENLKEYIGATILGNGLVTLILDVAALI